MLMELSLGTINPETLIVLQSSFACILYIFLFLLSGRLAYFREILRNWRKIGLLGLLSALQGLLFASGILISGPTTAAFILQLNFVFTIVFGVWFMKEGFSGYEVIGVLIAVLGVFVLTYGNITFEILGTIALLSAALLIAVTNLIAKVCVKNINPLALSGGKAFFIVMFMTVYSLFLGKLQTNILSPVFGYTFLSAATGAFLGFLLFYRALQAYDVSKVTVVRTSEPFLTALWALAFLSVLPSAIQLLGGGLVIAGIFTLALAREKVR